MTLEPQYDVVIIGGGAAGLSAALYTTRAMLKTLVLERQGLGGQILLTGGIPKMIQSSFKVLLEGGYSPVTAWFVCYYELKTIVDMFHSKGFEFMNKVISDTAEYGGITRGKRLVDEHVENEMRKTLKEIQSGTFHEEWQREAKQNFPNLSKLREEEKNLSIEKIGNQILKELFDKNEV